MRWVVGIRSTGAIHERAQKPEHGEVPQLVEIGDRRHRHVLQLESTVIAAASKHGDQRLISEAVSLRIAERSSRSSVPAIVIKYLRKVPRLSPLIVDSCPSALSCGKFLCCLCSC